MKLPPAVIVHGLGMAQAALATAAGRPLTLLSGEGAGAYAGVAWWQALVAAATVPEACICDVLDCGGAAGRALEALRAGQKLIVLRAGDVVWQDLAWRAANLGATLLADAPPALDLADRQAWRGLDAWLAAG